MMTESDRKSSVGKSAPQIDARDSGSRGDQFMVAAPSISLPKGGGAKTARGHSLIQSAKSVALLATSSSGARESEILVTTIEAYVQSDLRSDVRFFAIPSRFAGVSRASSLSAGSELKSV